MKIMNVQEFKNDQYKSYTERRTSQYTRFLDKSVDFVTYYNINQALSTASINNLSVDSYIGTDSPVRYNKIYGLPVYGFSQITEANTYSDDEGGFLASGYEGNIILLHDIIEPNEGDCFILDMFSKKYIFKITTVEQVVLRSKPHYNLTYTVDIPDYLPQLNRQVVEEYNAIFDNIGTQDKVVISKKDYDSAAKIMDIYKDIHEYYSNMFYKKRTTTIELVLNMDGSPARYTDKFLIKFMEENRVFLLDTVLKNSLVLDYNNIPDSDDYMSYVNTIYWAISNRSMNKFKPTDFIEAKKLCSPFSLITAQTDDDIYSTYKYSNATAMCRNIEYSFKPIYDKWKQRDITYSKSKEILESSNTKDRIYAIIVMYFLNTPIEASMFEDLTYHMTAEDDYFLLPLIMFIMKDVLTGLLHSPETI